MNQRPQHKTRYLHVIEEKLHNSLELISRGKVLQSRTPLAQALKRINKWHLKKLKSWWKTKNPVTQTKGKVAAYRMGKDFLPISPPIKS